VEFWLFLDGNAVLVRRNIYRNVRDHCEKAQLFKDDKNCVNSFDFFVDPLVMMTYHPNSFRSCTRTCVCVCIQQTDFEIVTFVVSVLLDLQEYPAHVCVHDMIHK
jgi:hypothetical protein